MAQKEISIVKDYWDWKSERVQVTSGMFLITISMLLIWLLCDSDITNSISNVYGDSLIKMYDVNQSSALHEGLEALSFTFLTLPRLILHIVTGCVVGLISLEISKVYGNRWGTSHSIWTTLLYLVCPTVVLLLYAGDGLFILMGALLAALALYFELRFRYLREDFYLIASVVALASSLAMDFVSGLSGLLGIILSRLVLSKVKARSFSKKLTYSYLALLIPPLLIILQKGGLREGHFSIEQTANLANYIANSPEHLIAHTKSASIVLTVSICTLGALTALRILVGTIWLRPLIYLCSWSISTFLIASFYIGGEHYLADSSVLVSSLAFYCSQPLAILFAFVALPAIDAINKPISITLSVTGCFCLSMLFLYWGGELYSAMDTQIKIQRDLKDFRANANQISQGYSKSELYLIGLPDSVKRFAISHKMSLSPDRESKVFKISDTKRGKDIHFINTLAVNENKTFASVDKAPIYLLWNDKQFSFEPITHSGRYNFSFIACDLTNKHLSYEPKNPTILKQNQFTEATRATPIVFNDNDQLSVTAGATALTIWLPDVRLDPSKCNYVTITLAKHLAVTKEADLPDIKFVWQADNGEEVYTSKLQQYSSTKLSANIFRNPNWLGKKSIKRIGIKFEPGNKTTQITKITIGKQKDKDNS